VKQHLQVQICLQVTKRNWPSIAADAAPLVSVAQQQDSTRAALWTERCPILIMEVVTLFLSLIPLQVITILTNHNTNSPILIMDPIILVVAALAKPSTLKQQPTSGSLMVPIRPSCTNTAIVCLDPWLLASIHPK